MKLVVYFGLMILSLLISIKLGKIQLKKINNLLIVSLSAVFINVTILALASLWWFFTETDGISQGLGVLYYIIAMGVIGIIDIIVLSVFKSKIKSTIEL
jgi:hypothetical protein